MKATNRDEEASREVGVPLQWSIATEISNGTTFVVRRRGRGFTHRTDARRASTRHCRQSDCLLALPCADPAGMP